jgi:hypothetical protein
MYRAEFIDGPCERAPLMLMGQDDPYPDLYLIPNPTDSSMSWIMVGYTGLEPDEPWPNQVRYALVAEYVVEGETTADYQVSDG